MKLFSMSAGISMLWVAFSLYVGSPWIVTVTETTGMFWAVIILAGIAFIPATIISFIYSTILLNKAKNYNHINSSEDVSIIIAAYNEEDDIINTLNSVLHQKYNGNIEVFIMNDGSSDSTKELVDNFINSVDKKPFKFIQDFNEINKGKSNVLNKGLDIASNDIIITIDADTQLHENAVQSLINTLVGSEENVVAVAGSIMVNNHKSNIVTKLQNWDYMLGISAAKQSQSVYNGVLVAQGAFSAYYKKNLIELGGWPETVGEDIVMTWKLLNKGYDTIHDHNAIAFTTVPEDYKTYFNQRKRWSRGLIEAFKESPNILLKIKRRSIFVWYNALFPFLDFCVAFLLIPSIIAAVFFKFYLLVGLMTLLVLPLSMLINLLMYNTQRKILKANNLPIEGNMFALLLYIIGYQIFQCPATLAGYTSEIFNFKKSWGTK